MDISILVLFLAGLITGFSKFSVGGMGLLILPIVMIAFPGPEALGMIRIMPMIAAVKLFFLIKKKTARAFAL